MAKRGVLGAGHGKKGGLRCRSWQKRGVLGAGHGKKGGS